MEAKIETKAVLRKIYNEKRMALSSDEVILFSELIFQEFISIFSIKPNSKIHCFLPIISKKEVNTHRFIDYFLDANCRVFVPKVRDGNMISIEIDRDTEWELSAWGIREPITNEESPEVAFDFCITPLLYCDKMGNRLGYGKGFYDRFFAEKWIINKIGLSFFEPFESIKDVYSTDIALDYLVIPNAYFRF